MYTCLSVCVEIYVVFLRKSLKLPLGEKEERSAGLSLSFSLSKHLPPLPHFAPSATAPLLSLHTLWTWIPSSHVTVSLETMKITATTELPSTIPAILSSKVRNASPDSDLISKRNFRKPARRKARTPASGARLKREGATGGRRSRPETPLLRWKFDDAEREKDAGVLDVDQKIAPEQGRRSGRKVRKGREVTVSARRLAAGLWRLQLPEVDASGRRRSRQKSEDRLGFEVLPLQVCSPKICTFHVLRNLCYLGFTDH